MLKTFFYLSRVLPVLFILVLEGIPAKLKSVQILDKDYLLVEILDGEVTHRDDGLGSTAFQNANETDADTVKDYSPHLDITAASTISSWSISSATDANYAQGLSPLAVYRKSKLNGHAQKEWQSSDYRYEHSFAHTLFLKLPSSLQQGAAYTLTNAQGTNLDIRETEFSYDYFSNVSESIHLNLVGFSSGPSVKAADLHYWLGDGGARDYSGFEGNKVYVINLDGGEPVEVGQVAFWKESGLDVGWYNLTASDVWNADFTGYQSSGRYRLAVEGVGASQPFEISGNIYLNPFMLGVQGFFYMRIGQDSTGGIWPVPRRPLYIPGDAENTTVYLTTIHPFNNWSDLGSGDNWDVKDWSSYRKAGNPTNPNAWGGHSDALDWDRHLGHVSIIYDMLLPFILSDGALKEDNLDIAESGNGIPDLLDEARYEVDFWLRLRDGAAYSHGVNNPENHVLYQAGPTGLAAWANAANAAMLGDCFRILGQTELMEMYRDSAIAAYNFANALTEPMLDEVQNVGDNSMRGRDFKITAAAYLYNLTGQTIYEDVIAEESLVSSPTSEFNNESEFNQLYALAGYLKSPHEIHYLELYNNMRASVIHQAKVKEANQSKERPSRRSTGNESGYWRTAHNLQRTMVAHALSSEGSDKAFFEDAMVLEADYGLGRNSMNMIQMTTQTTPLAHIRSVEGAYTSGRDDGAEGMHPGHTPYMNLDDWACSMEMGCPSKLYENNYPTDFANSWPGDEAYHNSRYVWAHNEFTPQQTMRGKLALYGYLHSLSKGSSDTSGVIQKPEFKVFEAGAYNISVYDIKGKLLSEFSKKLKSERELQFYLPQKSGIYLVQLRKGSYSSLKKMIRR